MTIMDWIALIWPLIVFTIGGGILAHRLSALLDAWVNL